MMTRLAIAFLLVASLVLVFCAFANGDRPRSCTVSTTTAGPDCASALTCSPSAWPRARAWSSRSEREVVG